MLIRLAKAGEPAKLSDPKFCWREGARVVDARRTTSRAEKLDCSLPLPTLAPVRKHHREYITMTKLTGKVRIRARRRAARDEPRRLTGNDNGGSRRIGAPHDS